MKNASFKIAVLMLALALMLAGCAQSVQQPIDVTAPVETPAAEQATEPVQDGQAGGVITEELLLPQDVPEEEAVYRLSYSAPRFGNETSDGAIAEYLDELYTRVVSERMPYADSAEELPYTSVSFETQQAELPAGIYTNVIFTEEHSFGGPEEAEFDRHVIVLGPDGAECSLAAVSGAYYPEDIAAQQVWNVIAYEPDSYFGDLTTEGILSALDLYNGFAVADEGYTLFIPQGTIAPEERGMIEISFPHRALYPGFVGDAVTEEVYEEILPALSAAAAACGPDFSGFSGAPTGELAAAFMNEYFLAKGVSSISAAEYSAAYRAVFGADISADTDPVVLAETGLPFYGAQWDDAHIDGDTVTLSGSLMSGAPGSSSAAPAASLTATLRDTGNGWALVEFEIM